MDKLTLVWSNQPAANQQQQRYQGKIIWITLVCEQISFYNNTSTEFVERFKMEVSLFHTNIM